MPLSVASSRGLLLSLLLSSACSSRWTLVDADGDGLTVADGDCWDALQGPPGSPIGGAQIFPGAAETWFDGVDQDCGGEDDYDADGDGFVPDAYVGLATAGVAGSGQLPGGDCWDDPATSPDAFEPMHGLYDAGGAYAQQGYTAPGAADVNPGVSEDLPYDGIDADCRGDDADGDGVSDDFDADGDGFASAAYGDRSGTLGDDCIDCDAVESAACVAELNPSGAAPEAVNPAASEVWYDGTDDDCDLNDCDADGDSFPASGTDSDTDFCLAEDCDDTDPELKPGGEVELYFNGVDDNCDLSDGDGDLDGDSWWASDYAEQVAANPDALDGPLPVPAGKEGDCDDSGEAAAAANGFSDLPSAQIHPGAAERYYDDIDQDCAGDDADGNGAVDDYDWDGDGVASMWVAEGSGALGEDCSDCAVDCVDSACAEFDVVCSREPENLGLVDPADIQPGASETWYDGTDQDCLGEDADNNGAIDDYDVDADGYTYDGAGGDDCDDGDPAVNPGATELCDAADVDEDCDGGADDADPDGIAQGSTTWFTDGDGDGYGDASAQVSFCDPPTTGYSADSSDCDDGDAGVNPGEQEVCDAADVDEDCDGGADDADPDDDATGQSTVYADTDADGYGDASASATFCDLPSSGYSTDATDCDDDDTDVNPGATEVCDAGDVDEDCDGGADDADPDGDAVGQSTWYADSDGDGYGDATSSTISCDDPGAAYSADDSDCDDAEDTVNPGEDEACNDGLDNDCDAATVCFPGQPDGELTDASVTLVGHKTGDQNGVSVLFADINGDGTLDLVMGSPEEGATKGRAYAVFGSTSLGDRPATTADTPSQVAIDLESSLKEWDVELKGDSNFMAFGTSLAATDADQDGYMDLLVGAPDGDGGVSNGGDVYVFAGPLSAGESIKHTAADYVFHGITSAGGGVVGGFAGRSLVADFDFDGDGTPDFAIGEPQDEVSPSGSGEGGAWIFLGPTTVSGTGEDTIDSAAVQLLGVTAGSMVGFSMASGDADGDGIDDLVLGAPYDDTGTYSANGAVYLVLGSAAPASSIDLSTAADAVYTGTSSGDRAGWAASLVDLDDDGYAEVVVGADGQDSAGAEAGGAWVFTGSSAPASAGLGSAVANILGLEAADRCGYSTTDLGDVNGDGVNDLGVGCTVLDNASSGVGNTGGLAVFYGVSGAGLAGTYAADDADAPLYGSEEGGRAGWTAAGGDLDGDGFNDILVGEPQTTEGTVWLVMGLGE